MSRGLGQDEASRSAPSTRTDADTEMMVDFLMEAWEQLEILDREFCALEDDPHNLERINTIFRVMHTLKGGAGFLGLEMLECLTHYAETLLARMRDGHLSVTRERTSLLLKTADGAKSILYCLEKDGQEGEARFNDLMVLLKRAAEATDTEASVPICRQQELSELAQLQARLLAALDPPAINNGPVPDPNQTQEELPAVPTEPEEPSQAAHTGENRIRVHVELLDRLMNLVGELVLSRNQIVEVSGGLESATLSSACQRLNLVTSELQDQIMQTRMQPISTLLNRFPRILRDLCERTHKEAQFSMEGQETGLDRAILDALKDPLVHIVRNAVDHGLEAPHIRIQSGKNARGQIHAKAYQEGGQVTVEITDDGAGIDLKRVRAKAVSQGLISLQESDRMSERDTLHLLFRAGFSTVDQVTNLSGRGVGMDVVRSSVERIGGTVDIFSRAGQGTTVKLRLPLTLAIIPALLVTCGDERYAIPQLSLQELVRLEGPAAMRSIERIHGAEVYRLRGELLPLLRLRNSLGLPTETPDTIHIVVALADGKPFGLVVDGLCDTEEIVVKPLTRQLQQLRIYAGATIMGDGRVALILDVAGLARVSGLGQEAVPRADLAEGPDGQQSLRQSLLLFGLGDLERYAIPLNLLSRLEEFPREQIETTRGKKVVQYRGRILPLLDLAEHFGGATAFHKELVQVVVLSHQDRELGLAVGEILDVVEEAMQLESVSPAFGTLGHAIVAGKATTVVDLYGLIQALEPDWLAPQAYPSKRAARRLLVVDDSAFCAALTSSYLQAPGIHVQMCRDRQSLLENLSRQQFDAIIVEAGCPEAEQMIATLTATTSDYRERTLATTQRGALRNALVPTIEPFSRTQLLNAVCHLAPVAPY
ncbi:chemotaxis protein CheW [bacterium]|nr:chemotaxis protein CheW [bacterium]